ncbi:hypothetical protein ACFQBQ_12545 [Granulicella cerasi]|uniref:Oligosaccharide repeat unit polymerase n=1 Tax=Granulicella cerasi TaxID=741063 RepID=A0ABW1ZBL5_9BACT|nr:hypothetical protein [Granulicella cerasi]
MRLSFFERIPVSWALTWAIVTAAVQIFLHTGLTFIILNFGCTMMWVLAMNVAGGLTRPSGSYIFWYGTLTVLIPVTLKAAVGEAPDTGGWVPTLTIAVYTVSMAAILLASVMSRRVTAGTRSLADRLQASRPFDFHMSALGCLMLSAIVFALTSVLPQSNGSFALILRRLDVFAVLAVLFGTVYAVQSSGGKKTYCWISLVAGTYVFVQGVFNFSKEGIITPFACWLVALAYTRFRLKIQHFVAVALIAFGISHYLIPVAQIGRGIPTDSFMQRVALTGMILANIDEYRSIQNENEAQGLMLERSYFRTSVGAFAERLIIWPADDTLISFSSHGNYIGYGYLWYLFYSWFPHVLLPNKEALMPQDAGGNYYARQIGMIVEDDTSTGISFGPAAEAFHFDGWRALIVMLPLLWALHFIVIDLIAGDIRRAPWGLFYFMVFSHMAAESAVSGLVGFIAYNNFGVIIGMFAGTFVAPLLGQLVYRDHGRRTATPLSGATFVH